MIDHFKWPNGCQPFAAIFQEFVAAHPRSDRRTWSPDSAPETKWALLPEAWDAATADLERQLEDFCDLILGMPGDRVVLAHDVRGPQTVHPSILLNVEPVPTMLGRFVVKEDRTGSLPIEEDFADATLYLPNDIVEALRRSYPARSEQASDRPEPTAPTEIVAEIVRQFDLGNVLAKEDARRRFALSMKRTAWLSLWEEATKLRSGLSKRGPKRHRQPPG